MLDVLGTWQHRGNVELYFKHRYNSFNYRIGKLTEYYKFKDVDTVLDDLYAMQPKILEGQELVIWDDYDSLVTEEHINLVFSTFHDCPRLR